MNKEAKKVDWTKALVLFFSIAASIGIAVVLYATKELFGLKIGLATYMVLSLHVLPSVVFYFRYIRGNTHWKRNSVFLAIFLVAQAIMGVGTLGFQFFVNGGSLAEAFNYAMLGLLFVKLVLVGTVIFPPILNFAEKLIAFLLGIAFYTVAVLQSVVTMLAILIFSPAITEPITNWLFEKANVKIRFHGPF